MINFDSNVVVMVLMLVVVTQPFKKKNNLFSKLKKYDTSIK